ncbi:MAG: nuclear transport factor 2 family protein [Steroidobacterales bacterium]
MTLPRIFRPDRLNVLALPLLAAAATPGARAATPDLHVAERTIIAGERQWADALVSGDTAAVERIVADDFVGVDPGGKEYDKPAAIEEVREAPKQFLSSHVNHVKVRFYGDTAVAQGDESWELRAGEHRRGRYVWTDTWVLRNGKWQIVAAEDLTVLDPER